MPSGVSSFRRALEEALQNFVMRNFKLNDPGLLNAVECKNGIKRPGFMNFARRAVENEVVGGVVIINEDVGPLVNGDKLRLQAAAFGDALGHLLGGGFCLG